MILARLMAAGRVGAKAGRGFYSWKRPAGDTVTDISGDNPGVPGDDPEVEAMLRACRRQARPISPDEISSRLCLGTLLEVTRVLDEGIAAGPHDVELALSDAMFRSPRDGILSWADRFGAAALLAMLGRFSHLGPRMEPTGRLLRMAARGETFLGADRNPGS